MHHGDTPSIILRREREEKRERRRKRDGGSRRKKKREGPKSRVLCLELVYGRSVKLSLRGRRVSKMAPAWGSADPSRNVEHGNLRGMTTIRRDISRSGESRENGVIGIFDGPRSKYFARGRQPYFVQEIARESRTGQKSASTNDILYLKQ